MPQLVSSRDSYRTQDTVQVAEKPAPMPLQCRQHIYIPTSRPSCPRSYIPSLAILSLMFQSRYDPLHFYHPRSAMLPIRLAAFALPLPASRSVCYRSLPAAASFPPWKTSPFRSPFSKVPRPLRPNSSTPPSANGSNPPNSSNSGTTGSSSPNDLDNGLFASSPELEQLAMKSTDAPILSRIVSYNILSSSLASPSHFHTCDPLDLDAATRLKRVLTKLEAPVASRSIICLQEVSLAWSGQLHAFFANRGFHLMLASHGTYFNGYMGEGLAFPLDLYEAVDLRIERLTDMTDWPIRPKPKGLSGLLNTISSRFQKALCALIDHQPRRTSKREPWDHARGRYNRFIFARLRSRTNGARICVGTYHMPCIFWSPPVMLIHSALVVRSFQRLCGSDDGVLAGDFNIKPNDSAYHMILKGEVDRTHQDYPPSAPDGAPPEKWFPNPLAPMKSAYREVLGSEPDFTNYAKVKDQAMFVETLDYIFCTEGVDVVDVMRLPHREAVQGPYPDASEPSDHVMIGATLRLQAPMRKTRRTVPAQANVN